MRTSARSFAWDPWSGGFDRASREDRPVFLYLFASWSPACTRLEQHVLNSPAVADTLAEFFVPVRVDVDLRPDVADRYGLDGWPSLLVLTPEGATLTGGQEPDAAVLASQLARVRDAFHANRDGLRAAAGPQEPPLIEPAGPGRPVREDAAETFLETVGDVSVTSRVPVGAWADHAATAQALLALAARGSQRARDLAEAWHDGAIERLVDRGTGGVTTPAAADSRVRHEPVSLLEDTAAVLDTLTAAAMALPDDRARGLASRIARLLLDRRHPSGGFVHAWDRHAGGAMQALLDGRRIVSANAAATCALLQAAQALGDASLAEQAVVAFERVVAPAYSRGTGIAHVIDPEPAIRGLLIDQVTTAWASLGAFDASGMRVYLDLAEELMRHVLHAHWHPEAGALQDRAPDDEGGPAARPLFPPDLNGLAARVLLALAHRLEAEDLAARARDLVGAWGPVIESAGPGAAHLVLATLELSAPRLE